MKPYGFERIGVLAVLLGAVVPAFAMQQHQEARPEQRQEQPRQPEARPEQRQEQPRQPEGQQRQPEARAPQARPQQPQHEQTAQHQAQPQHGNARPPSNGRPSAAGGRQQATWQDHRAQNFKAEHRSWQDRGGYHGYRIPDDRFRGSFGDGHRFRMSSYPMSMYNGYPRFQYGGLWLSVLDPWPEYWATGWYSNDDVYIGFSGGGYYMYNRSYPGDQIALSVSL